MSIKALPDEVVRQIKSSLAITSLNGVICGLVKNSLDAGANKINIVVDYSRGNCSVEDDGLGILPAEFREDGGLGKLHHTSKYSTTGGENLHGSNGDYISSLAALSLVTITSHHHQHSSHNSITLHNSKILSRNTPVLPSQRFLTFDHGTRVNVRDLFGSMAVRVKQRVAASEKAAVDREWGHLVRDVVGLLLAWPLSIALSMRDSVNHNEIRFRPSANGGIENDVNLLSHVSRTLAQAGLADTDDHDSWVSVGASAGPVSIDGCLSLNAVTSRRAQFISIGIQPVINEHGSNVLHEEINRVFTNSDFALEVNTADLDERLGGNIGAPSFKSTGFTGRELRPKRSLERWPMFYLRITLPQQSFPCRTHSVDGILDDSGKNLSAIVDLLKGVCYEFLKKYHFQPKPVDSLFRGSTRIAPEAKKAKDSPKMAASDNTPKAVSNGKQSRSRTKTPVSRPNSPFDFWQRVKVGKVAQPLKSASLGPQALDAVSSDDTLSKSPTTVTAEQVLNKHRLVDKSGNLTRRPFDILNPRHKQTSEDGIPVHRLAPAAHSSEDRGSTTTIESTEDAASAHWIATRTPQASVPRAPTAPPLTMPPNRIWLDRTSQGKIVGKRLTEVIPSWHNPVFEPAEPAIPRIGTEHSSTAGSNVSRGWCTHAPSAVRFEASTISLPSRLSKNGLVGAQVIAQVDNKFILAKLNLEPANNNTSVLNKDGGNSLMIIIDQHAADERCRLESLMREYFPAGEAKSTKARTQMLEKPLQFEFSAKECILLQRFSSHFGHWGISYKLEPAQGPELQSNSHNITKVQVISLPPSISERCKLEPRLLADLLRNESWKLDEEGGSRRSDIVDDSCVTGTDHDWVSRFQGCPQGILDMLNSRSCRSAIMFNDILSHDECTRLLRRLASCAFPFQCAHGRPSMAPLVDLHNFRDSIDDDYQGYEGRGRRLKDWLVHE